jgi:hypothetical protein
MSSRVRDPVLDQIRFGVWIQVRDQVRDQILRGGTDE